MVAAKIILLTFFSAGWILPLTWSVLAIHYFIHKVMWPQIVHLIWPDVAAIPIDSFYGSLVAHHVFIFSMAWLFCAICFWVVKYVKFSEEQRRTSKNESV